MRAWGILSLGVFLLTCALSAFVYQLGVISQKEIIPILLMSNGVWLLVMATLKRSTTTKREMGASLVAGWSAVLFALGLFLLLWWRTSPAIALAVFFTVMGAVVIFAGFAIQKKSAELAKPVQHRDRNHVRTILQCNSSDDEFVSRGPELIFK